MKEAQPILATILIVDDEVEIRRSLGEIIGVKYKVILAANSKEAMNAAITHQPSLILLDICMPGDDGISACRELRSNRHISDIPVIIMTGKDGRDTRIDAFNSGADDFLSKPFDVAELFSRIDAKLRRASEKGKLSFGNIKLNVQTLKVLIADQHLDLSLAEFRILATLLGRPGELVKRTELGGAIWGDNRPVTRCLDVHVTNLRKKLAASNVSLRAIYGEGYFLEHRKAS